MIPVADPFMAGIRPTGLQRGRGGFLRSADDAPYVSDPDGAMTNHDGNKPDLIALCVERGITVPAKVTVAQLHELLGQRPCRIKYGSPSKRGTEIENDAALVKWKQRRSFLGIGMDTALAEQCRDLTLLDADSDEFDAAADKIAVQADKLTRSSLAADRGTHGHAITEHTDRFERLDDQFMAAGELLGIDKAAQLSVRVRWTDMLAGNGLEILAIEACCVDDKWRLAGTLDRIVRLTRRLTFVKPGGELITVPADTVLVLDIKFGKTRKAHPIQIASYAQSVPYDTDTETRGVWPYQIDQTHALIAHGDFGDEFRPPSIELVWVDLVAGRNHGGQCVVDAKAWAARDDVFSVAQIVDEASDVKGARGPVPRSALERIMDRVVRTPGPLATDCWISTFAKDPDGYTSIRVDGRHGTRPQAHRVTYEALVGPIPDGLPLDHLCRVPACVNPEHLEPVTPAENSRRSLVARGLRDADPLSPESRPAVGEVASPVVATLQPSPAPSSAGMPDPSAPLTVGGEAGAAAGHSPATTRVINDIDELHPADMTDAEATAFVDAVAEVRADRLALVDARGQLCATPDEGADLSDGEFDELWDRLRKEFDQLPPTAKQWRSELAQQAKRRGVSFMAQEGKTERRYSINRGLIALAIVDADDEILRAILALVLGEIAWFVGIEPGHLVGSLNHVEAAKFADLCDTYISPPPGDAA